MQFLDELLGALAFLLCLLLRLLCAATLFLGSAISFAVLLGETPQTSPTGDVALFPLLI